MDKPNVIYAAAYDPSLERGFLTCSTAPMKHDAVEYIRKDALMELINKKLKESADRLDYRTNKAYAEILNKLNEI